jgi:DNA-binding GntR family transcriptional regulator
MKSTTVATPLQRDLLRRIALRLAEEGAAPGMRVAEPALARDFGVSRTPVRVALLELARQGVLRHEANRGFVLLRPPEVPAAEPDLAERILAGRAAGALPSEVSEAALMAAHGATRGTIRRALQKLAEMGLARRAAGHGWQFTPALEDDAARSESLAFRLAVEPAALLQPDWRAEPGLLARLAAGQRALLRARGGTPPAWARANEAFHEELAACSGNRFLLEVVRAQNALRRLTEVQQFPHLTQARIRQSCREHLGILAALEAGDRPRAAALMEAHLRAAAEPI